jgi:hypothetical protein
MTSHSFRPTTIEPLEHRIAPAVALVDLGSIGTNVGFTIEGVSVDDLAGFSVSAAGDINGDKRPDFIVGAPGATAGTDAGAGISYVVFGPATGFSGPIDLSALGTGGFTISGDAADDFSGQVVTRAGDLNGDKIDDLLISAPGQSPGGATSAGAVYILYGKRTGLAGANIDLATATGITKITGAAANDLLGASVAALGDVNGDKRADFIIGAPSTNGFTGASYVIFGKSGGLGATLSVATLNGRNGFRIDGGAADDNFGISVGGAGDVNRDGFADLIVGADGADSPGKDDAGAAYVIFGKRTFGATLAVSALTGTNGFKLIGAAADDAAGSAVSGAGDINRDGFADLVIGARSADGGGLSDSGAAYVVFGKRSGFAATLDLSSVTGLNGFAIPGHEAGAQLGSSVARAGDLNKDGFSDILLGASRANPNTDTEAGSAYAIFGKLDHFAASFDLAALDGIDGFRMDGAAAGNTAGLSLAAAGDLNRDGYADLIVGAPNVSSIAGTPSPGTAYVIYGTPLPVKISSDGRTATLLDTDGDLITVRVNKGRLAQADFTLGAFDRGLVALNLGDDGTEFRGANVSITATIPTGGTGDGLVNVGSIAASGLDLGVVSVRGDLGQIDAGDGDFTTTGLLKLSVRSLSAVGTAEVSTIDGRLGSFSSTGDVLGTIDVNGSIGTTIIRGDLDGSAGGTTAGLLRASGSIANVTVLGSIVGGADTSGLVSGLKLGHVSVGVDLTSADPAKPVSILAEGKVAPVNSADAVAIASLSVRGDVLNARILADTDVTHSQNDSNAAIGNVVVRGAWDDSLMQSTGNIGNVTVLGDFNGTNELGVVAGRRLGIFTVGGDIASANSAAPVLIVGAGTVGSASAAGKIGIASIVVKGNVTKTWFLAGYGREDIGGGIALINTAGSIGAVVVGTKGVLTTGTWNGSNLVAGVSDDDGDGFGQNDDAGSTGRIASIVIRGDVGIAGSHFGITAQQIGAASIDGVKLTLTSAKDPAIDLGGSTTLVEV